MIHPSLLNYPKPPEEDTICKVVDEIAIKARETEETFIFETVKPYCEYITRTEISKKDLEDALRLWQCAKGILHYESENN